MNEHNKAWLIALRSGEYKQGKGELRSRNNKFCCIGVACQVMNPNNWKENDIEWIASYMFDGEGFIAPRSLLKESGLSNGFYSSLYPLNDEMGFSFENIADYVEGKVNSGFAYSERYRTE